MTPLAIVNFVNYSSRSKSSQSRGCMRSVMKYVAQEAKTQWQGRQLVTGVNCQAQSAYDDFLNTKLLYHKDGGRMFYHLVQSFPSGAEVNPATAHAAALKLAEQFTDHEVLVCTHTDRDHIHSHLIINSVSFETGRKLHVDGDTIQQLKTVNDQICAELGLPVFEPPQERKEKPMSSREYRSADKSQSWKFALMATIDLCMAYAGSRKEFVELMKSVGYQVKWTDERKYITYTTPDDQRCRDNKLHEEKYLKENMEHEFAIRQAQVSGGAEGSEQARSSGGADTPQWSAPASSKNRRDAHDADDSRGRDEDAKPDSQPEQPYTGSATTGWENAREQYYEHRKRGESFEEVRAQLDAYRESLNNPDGADLPDLDYLAGTVAVAAVTAVALEDNAPIRDATTTHYHVDSKALKETRRKKIAMGHKPDDHEDEKPTWSQQMY